MTDAIDQLLARARAGDARAFADLVAEHGPDVLRLCAVITNNHALAQDAAQNTWQKAWRRLDTIRDPASLRSWLLRVAANESKQVLRSNRRHAAQSLDAAGDLAVADRSTDDAALRAALATLAPADRELLGQRYVLGFSSEEIGRLLGLSPEGVRSRLKRVRDRLQTELTKDA